jgi:hypothetical protein
MPLTSQPLAYATRPGVSIHLLGPALRAGNVATLMGGVSGVSCVLLIHNAGEWAFPHAILFAITALAAFRSQRMFRRAAGEFPSILHRGWPTMDAMAAVLTFFIGLLPWIATWRHTDIWHWNAGRAVLGVGLGILAGLSVRHRFRYRTLAAILGPGGSKRAAYLLNAAGDTRAGFELVYLSCVAAALFGPAVNWLGRPLDPNVQEILSIAVFACAWVYGIVWATALVGMAWSDLIVSTRQPTPAAI